MSVHEKLVERMSDEELERKAELSFGRAAKNYWTQEEIDACRRRGFRLWQHLNGTWE